MAELDKVMQKINEDYCDTALPIEISCCDDHISRYLQALVALAPFVDSKDAEAPSDAATTMLTLTDEPENKIIPGFGPRIIYLRDFDAISCSSVPFLKELLAAIRIHRNSSNQGSAVVDPSRLRRVILVLGMSRPLDTTGSDQSRFESAFGAKLHKLIPDLGNPYGDSKRSVLVRAFSKAYRRREQTASSASKSVVSD